jgi:hypothetical protein
MATREQTATLRAFFNAIPLQVPIVREGGMAAVPYVPGLHSSEGRDPVGELATNISFNEAAAAYLFTGHRGSGKTTELLRLRKELSDQGCTAFYVDMVDYLNETSPLSIADLLVTLLGALSDAYNRKYQQHPLARGYWERFKDFLTRTDVTVSEAGVSVPGELASLDVKLAMKSNPTFKQKVKDKLDTSLQDFIKDARAFADEVVGEVRKQEDDAARKVVLIVDSLEKIRGSGTSAQQIYDSINDTFHGNAANLRFSTLHVVYSVPPTLPLIAPGIGALYSGGLWGLPQVKVEATPGESGAGWQRRDRHPDGLNKMLQVVQARFQQWSQVCSQEQLEELAHASGGNLRVFFLLIQRVLLKAPRVTVPLADHTLIEQAKDDVRADMQLTEEDQAWLRKVRDTHSSGLDRMTNLATLGRLCDNLLILDYRNGRPWFDVLPLVREKLG